MQKRPYLISLFLFVVVGMLAIAAWQIPPQGIPLGEYRLHFAQIDEYLHPLANRNNNTIKQLDTVPILTEKELEVLYIDEETEEQKACRVYLTTALERIHLPIHMMNDTIFAADSLSKDSIIAYPVIQYDYFDAFFAALEGADTLPVNIAHYGDSQLEEDRMTMVLREGLQKQFGGGGLGTMPLFQPVPRRTISQQTHPEPNRYAVHFNNLKRSNSTHYGALGQVAVLDNQTISVSFSPRSKQSLKQGNYFNRISLYCRPAEGQTLSMTAANKIIYTTGEGTQLLTIPLGDNTTKANASVAGSGDVYGIRLHNTTGVTVDNIPMRGCSGTVFSSMDANDLKKYFSETRTRLIIMQFGGNTAPHLYNDKRVETYTETLIKQVQFMQKQCPEAAFLFIGPTDMTTTKNGTLRTYPRLAMLDEQLCKRMTEAGIAYWSMFDTMGGEGAMKQWVADGLAGHDYIHFTPQGAEKMGNLLYAAIQKLYEYYLLRPTLPVANNL